MRVAVVATAVCLSLVGLSVAENAKASIRKNTNIPAEGLGSALQTLAKTYQFQVLYRTEVVGDLRTAGAVGTMTAPEALSKVLSGTGLSFKYLDDNTVTIILVATSSPRSSVQGSLAAPQEPTREQKEGKKDSSSGFLLAQVAAGQTTSATPVTQATQPSEKVGQLQEVVVTARKRAENLQDVPLSITAFSAADVEHFNFRNVQDIAFSVPNFTWGRLTTISEIICIRGICSDSSASGFDTSIAVVLDDVYIGRAAGFTTSLLDVDSMEILRGPQGTLQARNATGGAINITTERPSNEFHGTADISYGNYDQLIAQAVLSGPIVADTLSGKIAVSRRNHEGFEENIDVNKPLDTEDSYALRGQLRFTPTRNLEALVTGDFDHFNNHDFHNAFGPPGVLNEPAAFFTRQVGGNFQNYGSREVYGSALNIYWALPNELSLASVSSYRGFRVVDVQDFSGQQNFGPRGAGTIVGTGREDQEQRQFSQEVRLTSRNTKGFSWLGGLFYYWEELRDYQNFLFGGNTGTVINGSDATDNAKMYTNGLAAFGSATWDLSKLWSVTTGLRDTRNSRHITMLELLGIDGTAVDSSGMLYTYVNMPTMQNPVPVTFQAPIIYPLDHNALTDRAWTGDLTLTQHWQPDVSTYQRYAHGFKGGGFNANFNNGFGAGVVKPEFIDSFEVGVRSELLDRRLRINATTYYLKQRDQQVLIFDAGLNLYVTSNAPSTRSYGAELDISSAITRDLIVSLSVGSTDAHFKAGGFANNLVPYTSPLSTTATVQYTRPVAGNLELFAFTDVSWKDGYYTSPDNQPVSHQKSYVWADARLGLQSPTGRWSAGLYVRNAFNTNVLAFGVDAGIFTVGFIQEPRTWGFDARMKF